MAMISVQEMAKMFYLSFDFSISSTTLHVCLVYPTSIPSLLLLFLWFEPKIERKRQKEKLYWHVHSPERICIAEDEGVADRIILLCVIRMKPFLHLSMNEFPLSALCSPPN